MMDWVDHLPCDVLVVQTKQGAQGAADRSELPDAVSKLVQSDKYRDYPPSFWVKFPIHLIMFRC